MKCCFQSVSWGFLRCWRWGYGNKFVVSLDMVLWEVLVMEMVERKV